MLSLCLIAYHTLHFAQVCLRADEIAQEIGFTKFRSSHDWYSDFCNRFLGGAASGSHQDSFMATNTKDERGKDEIEEIDKANRRDDNTTSSTVGVSHEEGGGSSDKTLTAAGGAGREQRVEPLNISPMPAADINKEPAATAEGSGVQGQREHAAGQLSKGETPHDATHARVVGDDAGPKGGFQGMGVVVVATERGSADVVSESGSENTPATIC
jgi:hypothetical protein